MLKDEVQYSGSVQIVQNVVKILFRFLSYICTDVFYDKNIQKRKTLKILTKNRDKNKKTFFTSMAKLVKTLNLVLFSGLFKCVFTNSCNTDIQDSVIDPQCV